MASNKKDANASAPITQEELAGAAMQVQVQQTLAVMQLQAATFAHALCTSTSSSGELSNKEKRCINQTVAGYVNAAPTLLPLPSEATVAGVCARP